MTKPRRIYLLDPKTLTPETIAVAFAKTSRSPKCFDKIASELSEESSADFHEKWVVGYGHSSVAEHAVLHIAVEHISRLAIESLESNRLASYTEKSSRYQIWDEDHFYIPDEIKWTQAEQNYLETCKMLFSEYQLAFTKISAYLLENEPHFKNETERAFNTRMRSQCADVCRYFLPTSALANVGISINARALEHTLRKMLSHPLAEVRAIGEEIKVVSVQNVPTLVKYANANEYLVQIGDAIRAHINDHASVKPKIADWCACVDQDDDGEIKVLAALLYRFSSLSFSDALTFVSGLSKADLAAIAEDLLGKLDDHDVPLRELEYAHIAFDLVMDQGAYFELKRHRMMSQTVQEFTPHLGYAIPKLIFDSDLLDRYTNAMEKAKTTFASMQKIHPHAAAYVLPNGFNRRILLKMNLRSALHLIKLRCAPNAHFAIRRPTQKIAQLVREKYPLFSTYFDIFPEESWQSLEENHFYKTS